jgi:hypothetical protein
MLSFCFQLLLNPFGGSHVVQGSDIGEDWPLHYVKFTHVMAFNPGMLLSSCHRALSNPEIARGVLTTGCGFGRNHSVFL